MTQSRRVRNILGDHESRTLNGAYEVIYPAPRTGDSDRFVQFGSGA